MPVLLLTEDETMRYLTKRFVGRLATISADGEPYITPLNYVVHKGKVYFHCSLSRHKLDISQPTTECVLR